MKIVKYILIKIIKFYKLFISPYLGNNCRYLPTCSEYFIDSLDEHGVIKGSSKVRENFSYRSNTNKNWLNSEELKLWLKKNPNYF